MTTTTPPTDHDAGTGTIRVPSDGRAGAQVRLGRAPVATGLPAPVEPREPAGAVAVPHLGDRVVAGALPDLVTRHPARGHRATAVFVAQLVGLLLGALLVIGLFDWTMDPWGVFAHGGAAPLVQPDERADKVAMLAKGANPGVVLLGSSRMLRYDPAIVTAGSATRGFNASVAGSNILDAAAFTGWLADRHAAGRGVMPHVVYGLGVEEFRAQPSGAVLDRVPELAAQVRPESVPFGVVSSRTAANLKLRWVPLLELSTVRASLRSLGRELSGGPAPVDTRFRTRWAANGLQLRGHDDATLRHGKAGWREVRTFRNQYLGFYERRTAETAIPADARAQLEHLLRVANDAGDAPTLFLLPMRDGLAQELGPIGRDAQTAAVRAYLHDLRAEYRFTWRDLSKGAAPGDAERGWYDDVHPRRATAKLVLQRLRAQLGAAALRGDATRAARARR